jgi:hypothetical protein
VQVGHATSGPAGLWVPLTTALTQGRTITATQTYTGSSIPGLTPGVPSEQSNEPVPVEPLPSPLPSPVFVSWITTCTDSLYMGGLIPGCTLEVTMGATTLVSALITRPNQYFGLPAAPLIPVGATLTAQQKTGTDLGPVTTSQPVTQPGPLNLPQITDPPVLDCETALDFANLTPGADLRLINAGNTVTTLCPWNTIAPLYDLPPLQVGTLTAQLYYGRCRDIKPGPIATFPVGKQRPKFPQVNYPLCTDIRQLSVTNLIAGEILTVYRSVPGQARTIVGYQGVSGSTATVNLPTTFQATDPAGPVSVELQVTLCGIPSDPPGYTTVTFPASAGGPYPPPKVRPPLYDCARAVQVTGVHPGSLIQVYSAPSGLPRSNAAVATTTDPVVPLWSPLITGERIYVEVQGCNARGPSAQVAVQPVPDPLEPPVIVNAVAGAPDMIVTGVYQGAQVYLFVNGSFRSYVDTNQLGSFDAPLVIPIPSGTSPLAAGNQLQVTQALCTEISESKRGGPGTATVATAAPQPVQGLGSSFNHVFYSNCHSLLGVEVTINVTQDIVSSNGFTIQLNAYGGSNQPSGWQQYGFLVNSPEVQGFVNNWPPTPSANPANYYVLNNLPLASLPSSTLPAGYILTLALAFAGATVSGVTYTVTGNGSTNSAPQTLTSAPVNEPAGDLSPIVAFEVDIVGPGGGTGTIFSSGAGTITYAATTALTGLAAPPAPCCEWAGGTGEYSNSIYGPLPSPASTTFTQTFSLT